MTIRHTFAFQKYPLQQPTDYNLYPVRTHEDSSYVPIKNLKYPGSPEGCPAKVWSTAQLCTAKVLPVHFADHLCDEMVTDTSRHLRTPSNTSGHLGKCRTVPCREHNKSVINLQWTCQYYTEMYSWSTWDAVPLDLSPVARISFASPCASPPASQIRQLSQRLANGGRVWLTLIRRDLGELRLLGVKALHNIFTPQEMVCDILLAVADLGV